MATVPQYEIGQVKDRPVSGGFQQIQTNSDAFGASIAQANINQGQAISQLGDQAWQAAIVQRDKQDQATLRERDNLLTSRIRELMSDPEGYLSLTGRNAVDARESVQTQIEEYKKELAKDLDPRILDQFNQFADQRLSTAFNSIASHARTQTNEWNNEAREGRIASQIQNVVINYNNPTQLKTELQLGLREVDSQIQDVYGIDPSNPKDGDEQAVVDKARLAFTSKAHEGVIDNLLANDRYLAAQTYFEDNMKGIDATRYDEIKGQLMNHTRVGEINSNVESILAEGGTHAQSLTKARAITDQVLANDVVSALKVREQERLTEVARVESEALDSVNSQIADGARTRAEIDPADWAAMSGTAQANTENYLTQLANAKDAELDEIKRENEEAAKNAVYDKLRLGQEVTQEDLMKLSGTDAYQFTKELRASLLTAGNDINNAAYEVINTLISEGKTYKEIQKTNAQDWSKMSGQQKRSLKAILDTTAEKLEADEEQNNYDAAIRFIAGGDYNIHSSIYENMSAVQELDVKNRIQNLTDQAEQRSRNAQTTLENESYSAVLKHLVAGGTLDDLEDGLFDKLNGTQQTNITNAIATADAKTAKAQLDIDKQKNWLALSAMAVNDYQKFMKEPLDKWVGLLTDANHSKLVEMQLSPGNASMFGTKDNFLKMMLGSLGYNYTEDSTEDNDAGRDIRRFIGQVDVLTQAHFVDTGKEPNPDEYKAIITGLMTDIVWNDEGVDEQEPLIMVDDLENAYVRVPSIKGTGYVETVYLKDIPDLDRAQIIKGLIGQGKQVTEQAIAEHFYKANNR